jgi:outer membrane protein assembly factor BamA
MFYRHERAITRFTADFQGRLHSKSWRWLVGAGHFNYALATVDVDALNKGLKSGDKLPDVPTLYDKYVDWGVISPSERKGGMVNYLKGGVIYDTRDLEANPTQGMWSEALLFYGADWLGSDSHYLKLVLTHRHYFTLIPERLTLACRGMWQGTVAGDVPFYMEPYGISSYSKLAFTDMLGGARSVRGTLRNRVVGSGFALLNIEPRWKVFRTVVKKQNLYFALSTFLDAGMVTNQRSVEVSGVPDEERSALFNDAGDNVHMSVGAGLHIALNENFVLAIDYGKALRAADGKDGLYINLGFLF